jgi:membrane fusion protein (multidrug efflux system)
MPLPRKPLLITAGVVTTAVILWFATDPSSKPAQPAESSLRESPSGDDVAFPVSVAVARRGALIKSIATNGTLRAHREVELLARVAGEVVGVYVRNGQRVQAGEVLVKLDDREYRLAYEKASAALLAAQIEYRTQSTTGFLSAADSQRVQRELHEAEERFREAERAYREQRLDAEAYHRAQRDYEAAVAYLRVDRGDIIANKSGLAAAKEAYTRAKLDWEATEVRAPFAGYVGNLDLTPGKRIQAGTAVCTLVDRSTLLVDGEVLEMEALRVRPGQRAELAVAALPGRTFTGKVIACNPIIDPKTKTLRVTIELTNLPSSNSLMPGMYATVRIQTETFADRLLVPKAALLVRDQRPVVFVAQQGLAKWHYVDVEDENDQFIAIRSGIEPGDTVIVDGHYTLAHDARIRVTK